MDTEINPIDLISRKRDGQALTDEDLKAFIEGYTAGRIPDYQAAALCMAVHFQGMTDEETTALTLAMAESGKQLRLHPAIPEDRLIVDKHSSGGVGDKTSLVVAPIVASLGIPVAKMTGRGLSFSGGTIDKLESISGWSGDLVEEQFLNQLKDIGLVIAAQTDDLAPADRKLYALRDVTGTVPSLPLIASSIMSKKLAAGADAIVLDVKVGRGTFMETEEEANALAYLMVAIGLGAGRRMSAVGSHMDQPLGFAVGNSLEVKEAIATLSGNGPPDFVELVTDLCLEMMGLAEKERDPGESGSRAPTSEMAERVEKAISSGDALEKFTEFVQAQGGNPSLIEHPDRLPDAPVVKPLLTQCSGWITGIDAREVGLVAVDLGGGRMSKEDAIDPRVGVVLKAKVGDRVELLDPVLEVHAARESDAERALQRLEGAIAIGWEPVEPRPVIRFRHPPFDEI